MPEWTKAQSDAINAKNSNILVSAAAGSGKTAVLVERVINKILDVNQNVNLDELLVVTFTNAAASEMKVRISRALTDILKQHPNHSNALKQLSLVPNAQISTIDSFCLNLVKENFFKLDIEQDFRILDTSEASIIEDKAAQEVVEELYETGNEEFKALSELLSTPKNDDELINCVKRIHTYISAQPYPFVWLNRISEFYRYDVSVDDSDYKKLIIDEIRFLLDYLLDTAEFLKTLLNKDDEMYEKYSEMLASDTEVINSLISSLDGKWDDIRNAFSDIEFMKTPSKRGFEADYKDILLEKRKLYSAKSSVINNDILPLLAPSAEDIENDNKLLYPLFNSLIDLIKRYDERMLEIKKEISAYTFSDIEHFAIKLLFTPDVDGFKRTGLANELQMQYKEILVDEYQDTNTAQDTLFSMLSDGKNRFMVGDVKQSIYRFRLAMPSIFTHKRDEYTPYRESSDSLKQKIILDKNFRSREAICGFTNFLFSHLMSRKIGELDYSDEDFLNYGASYPETNIPSAQLYLCETEGEADKTEAEAHRVAKLILDKIKNREQIYDNGILRDIRFGDFAILLRSAKTTMPKYSKVFSEYGIPTVANNRINLFDNNEVSILLSLLRVIDNPVQDIPLLATLMSVFYGYTPDDIAFARVNHKADSLYSSISAECEKFSRILSDIERYKKYASSMSVESFIRLILSETSYLSLISVMGNAEQRRLNVFKFIELAKSFDNGENVGLTAFIRYIDSVIEAKAEIESAELSGADENAVKIMSVHKSKGLEFPIVILADSAHQYNTSDEKASLLLNNELGIGLKVNVEEGLYRYNSVQYNVIKTANSNAAMSENLRVLYVAVTRAKEQFIAFASFNGVEKHIGSVGAKLLGNRVPPYAVKKIMRDADLLLMCALLHKDCDDLRKHCYNIITPDTSFDFPLSVTLLNDTYIDEALPEEERIKPDEKTVDAIQEKLSFRYERSSLGAFKAKRAASELDDREHSFKYFAKSRPSFLSEGNMTAAQKGTAMHAFMQYCDYESAKQSLEKEIERLTENGYISEAESQALDTEKLSNLFNSDFAKRIFSSDRLYRELKVSSFVCVDELENTDFKDKVLVQGIADCVFEEDGKLVLVDYKTDFVRSEAELLDMYKKQLAFYKTAVEKTLGKEVKEVMLYSFALGKPCVY